MPTASERAIPIQSTPMYDPLAHRRLTCSALLLITIPVGLAWRFAPLHLPPFAFKYGGSMLWAMGVYWLLAIILARKKPLFLSLCAAMIAVSVELFKLLRDPAIDRFRETLAGKVLIGRHFTVGAIIAYVLAIAVTAVLDARFRPGRPR